MMYLIGETYLEGDCFTRESLEAIETTVLVFTIESVMYLDEDLHDADSTISRE